MLQPKPLFAERIEKLLPDKRDREKFWKIVREPLPKTIRCNTLKISPEKLKERLEKKWKIFQPCSSNLEIFIVESDLMPGELGKSIEHILGYYYIQEISSMMPPLALNPKPTDIILDLTASPGSKTTQISALMQNKGTIMANDKDIGRIKILASNLEKCSCSNVIVTRHDAVQLCEKLKKLGMKFDKILLDLPCSGEGNIRSNEKTFLMWNIKMIQKLSRLQKKLASSAIPLLKSGGEVVYSTCTHAPEENESVVNFLLENFPLELEEINLPIKTRQGLLNWNKESFHKNMSRTCRIYPQDNNTEGFFLAKMRLKCQKHKNLPNVRFLAPENSCRIFLDSTRL